MTTTHGKAKSTVWRLWTFSLFLTGSIQATPLPAAAKYSGEVRQAVAPLAPGLTLTPHKLAFDAQVGSGGQMFKDVRVSSPSGGISSAFTASVQSGGEWLSLNNPLGGPTPGVLRVFVAVGDLPVGVYNGVILVSMPGGSGQPIELPVALTVRGHPAIILRPSTLTFSCQGGFKRSIPQPQTLSVFGENTDFSVLTSIDPGMKWLHVDPPESTTPANLTVSVDPSGLDPGTHEGTLTIVASGASNSGSVVHVELIVTTAPDTLVSPKSISFQAQYGSHQPVADNLLAYTNGNVFELSASTGGQAAWLSVRPRDAWVGSVDTKTGMVLPTPTRLRVSADPTGLAPGTYSGAITLVNPEAPSSEVSVPVTLEVRPNDLIVPQVADGGGWDTTIILVNTDSEPAPFTLRLWQPDGEPLLLPLEGIGGVSQYSDTIPVGGTRILQTAGRDPAVSAGWAEVIAERSIGATVIFRQHRAGSDSEATVVPIPPLDGGFRLPFDNADGVLTGLAVANTGPSPTTLTLDFRDENGMEIVSGSLTLPSHNHRAFMLGEMFPQIRDRRGVARISSTSSGLSALGLRFNPTGSFTSIQPAEARSAEAGPMTQYISQIATGGGWKTTIFLANSGTQPATFSLIFRDSGGTLLDLPMMGAGATAEYSDVIPAGGARILETQESWDPSVQGWAEIVSDTPISGTVVFTQTAWDGSDSEAAEQVSPPPGERFVLPFDNTQGFLTALALLNGDSSDALSAVVILRDESGERLDVEYIPQESHTSETFYLAERFPSTQGRRGSIEFRDARISVLGLRFSPSGTFTSVAPIR
jgi:hypothetical protein